MPQPDTPAPAAAPEPTSTLAPRHALSPAPRLGGLLSLTLLVGTVNGLSRVALPLYIASLGAQPWQVGVAGAFGYAGILLLALPMGAWIDRHGSRPLFLRGVAVASVLYLVLPVLGAASQAMLAMALLGLVLPFRTIPAQTEFLALLPSLSPGKAGWNRAATMTGMFFLGPALSAAAIAGLGFPPVFELAAAGLLLAFLLGGRVLGQSPALANGDDSPLVTRIRAQLALLRGHAEVRRTMSIDFLTQMAVAYFIVFGLVLAVRRLGMPLQAAAGLVTLQGAMYVVTLLLGGKLMARFHEDRLYVAAFVLIGLQCLLFGLAWHPAALWVGSALMGIAVGIQGLVSTSRFADLMRQYGRGRVGGLTSLGPPAGGLLGALAGGAVSQNFGTQAGFLLLAVVYGLMAAVRLRARTNP